MLKMPKQETNERLKICYEYFNRVHRSMYGRLLYKTHGWQPLNSDRLKSILRMLLLKMDRDDAPLNLLDSLAIDVVQST